MTTAIYALSGDPITYGHIDVIERAARVFDKLVVGIGINPLKKHLFSLEERQAIAAQALRHLPNIKLVTFTGNLVDYAYEQGIGIIVRGVRDAKDFEYEVLVHQVGESQNPDMDTFILPARRSLSHISSSAVKALQTMQGLIHDYVPLYAKQMLEQRLSQQHIIAITGEIGMGKTYLSQQFQALGQAQNMPVHWIHIDALGHEMLEARTEPVYHELRQAVVELIGHQVRQPDGMINPSVLGQAIFADKALLQQFNALLYKPLLLNLRRRLLGLKGLIILDSALIAESEMLYLCNNHVILVQTDKATQQSRLEARGYSPAQIQGRLNSQYDTATKRAAIQAQIAAHGFGKLWVFDNLPPYNPAAIEALFTEVAQPALVSESV